MSMLAEKYSDMSNTETLLKNRIGWSSNSLFVWFVRFCQHKRMVENQCIVIGSDAQTTRSKEITKFTSHVK